MSVRAVNNDIPMGYIFTDTQTLSRENEPSPTGQSVPPANASHDLDPALVALDTQRKKRIETQRASFSQIFSDAAAVQNPIHLRVKEALVSMVFRSPDRQKYVQYLTNLFLDLTELETQLESSGLSLKTLPPLYRSQEIQKDILFLSIPADKVEKRYDHKSHFETLKNKPHLLLPHYSVHVLGFFAGGRHLSKGIAKAWGLNGTNLYQFTSTQLRQEFESEMDSYVKGLSEEQFAEFLKETQTAWEFAEDLLRLQPNLDNN